MSAGPIVYLHVFQKSQMSFVYLCRGLNFDKTRALLNVVRESGVHRNISNIKIRIVK